jgi:hypothetical protein
LAKTLDLIAQAVFSGDHVDRCAPAFLAGITACVPAMAISPDGVGVIAAIGEQRMDPIVDQAKQPAENLHACVRSGVKHKAERTGFRIA